MKAAYKKTKKPKEVKPVVHVPTWKTVATRQVKWESFTMAELKEWIKENAPGEISDDHIQFSFEINEEWGYYDDVTTEAVMSLSVFE